MKDMLTVTSGELQKQFGRYSDEAMIRPVGVTRNGRLRFVMVPAEDYDRLARRETASRQDRVAGLTRDLDGRTLGAIAAVEPGAGSIAAERN